MSAPAERIRFTSAETILVLDNDALFRMPLCEYLREGGYRVLEAASTEEAKTILQKWDVKIDVVLTDIELSGN